MYLNHVSRKTFLIHKFLFNLVFYSLLIQIDAKTGKKLHEILEICENIENFSVRAVYLINIVFRQFCLHYRNVNLGDSGRLNYECE